MSAMAAELGEDTDIRVEPVVGSKAEVLAYPRKWSRIAMSGLFDVTRNDVTRNVVNPLALV